MSNEMYYDILGHLNHHHAKKYLLNMCEEEDARTIKWALLRISSEQLNKGLAKVLSDRSER